MSISAYSFLIKKTVTLLNEEEWAMIEPLAKNRIERIKAYRQATGLGLAEALEKGDFGQEALQKYEEMTGVKLDHPDHIWAVEMSRYGALCPECAKPFRTERAKMCVACGYHLPEGQLAGPLTD